jgi:predicted RNA-binding Zn ribbon-like protein
MEENFSASLPFEDIGGRVWVDFANAEVLAQRNIADVFASEAIFLGWLQRHGIQAPISLGDLALARELRTHLGGTLPRLARGEPLPEATLKLVQRVLSEQSRWILLTGAADGYRVQEVRRVESLADALGPIVESFAETLAHEDLRRLRKCESESCDLYFLDDSRNGRRRWCSMAHCGNRSKAARFQARNRA